MQCVYCMIKQTQSSQSLKMTEKYSNQELKPKCNESDKQSRGAESCELGDDIDDDNQDSSVIEDSDVAVLAQCQKKSKTLAKNTNSYDSSIKLR